MSIFNYKLPLKISHNSHFYAIIYQVFFLLYLIGYALINEKDFSNNLYFLSISGFSVLSFSVFIYTLIRKDIVSYDYIFVKYYCFLMIGMFIPFLIINYFTGFNSVINDIFSVSLLLHIFANAGVLAIVLSSFHNSWKEPRIEVPLHNILIITGKKPDLIMKRKYSHDALYQVDGAIFSYYGYVTDDKVIGYHSLYNYLKDQGKKFKEITDDDLNLIDMISI